MMLSMSIIMAFALPVSRTFHQRQFDVEGGWLWLGISGLALDIWHTVNSNISPNTATDFSRYLPTLSLLLFFFSCLGKKKKHRPRLR